MWQYDETNDSKARNRLSFTDRVKAIEAYEKHRNYTKVGLMFKCSAKQIRSIVINKEKILAQYGALPESKTIVPEAEKPSSVRRLKKISLLGAVMYEWFLRARRNTSICIISYKQIQNVALEVKRILNVENFSPNSAWLLHFRQKYNISDSDMKLKSNEPGPSDLDIEDIVAHVVISEKNRKASFGLSDDSSSSDTQNLADSLNEPIQDCSDTGLCESDNDGPSSKYPKLETIDVIEIESDDENYSGYENDDDDAKGSITTIEQALEHLKPLEEFALLKENYRAIGLVTQLEEILRNSQRH